MPRKTGSSGTLALREVEDTIIQEESVVLSLEERTALRAMFAHSAFKKALHNARLSRPSEFAFGAHGALNTALGGVIANNRLHEMRGWRMFEAALGRQVQDPKLPKPPVPDDYGRER